uniref:carboxypeptidase-like regulatory domain-containing protein n=1 Tax=Devosia albogilva TaxID=429726 RepID=UPI0036DEEE6B
MNFLKSLLLLILLLSTITSFSQKKVKTIKVIVLNEKNIPFQNATVELLYSKNLGFIKAAKTDKKGIAIFNQPMQGNYVFNAKAIGYESHKTTIIKSPFVLSSVNIKILPSNQVLKEITVEGHKSPIQHIQGKIVLNVDAVISNTGTTVLELLENLLVLWLIKKVASACKQIYCFSYD